MKPFNKLKALLPLSVGFTILLALHPHNPLTVSAQSASPTPTYDPLAEPPLSSSSTQFELGRNLYWHWCMPCHGDRGQGLTDEWRSAWVPDHQDCWARGCHAGRPGDGGFPIPTVVPAIVASNIMAHFDSSQILFRYLRATHPPQHPGLLQDREYQAIAAYVFDMNGKAAASPTPLPSPTAPAPTRPAEETTSSMPWLAILSLTLLLTIGLIIQVQHK